MRKGGLTTWREEKEIRLITYFAIFYLTFFGTIAALEKNFEFLFYTIAHFITLLFIVRYNRKMHMPVLLMFGLVLIGILHIAGSFELAAGRLCDLFLIKGFLRYDNFVHFYSMFIVTFIIYNIIHPHLDPYARNNPFFLTFVLLMASIGVGAFSEVIEFQAVVLFGATENVGGYFNNAIDLIYNFVASLLACFIILQYQGKQRKNEMRLT